MLLLMQTGQSSRRKQNKTTQSFGLFISNSEEGEQWERSWLCDTVRMFKVSQGWVYGGPVITQAVIILGWPWLTAVFSFLCSHASHIFHLLSFIKGFCLCTFFLSALPEHSTLIAEIPREPGAGTQHRGEKQVYLGSLFAAVSWDRALLMPVLTSFWSYIGTFPLSSSPIRMFQQDVTFFHWGGLFYFSISV